MPLIDQGQAAPAIELPDQDGTLRTLAEHTGHPVVVYFYPKDDTPGCTTEACQFRDDMPAFEKSGAVIVGISPDDQKSHRQFADKYDLPFRLLADVPGLDGIPRVCGAYGVWQEKSMSGRTYMGVVRTTYLIDADGRVARRWDQVKVPGHAEELFEAVSRLEPPRV